MTMIFLNIKKTLRSISVSLAIITALCFIVQGCFLFPPVKPIDKPDTTVVVMPPFVPTLMWITSTRGVAMDVGESGDIVSAGDTIVDGSRVTIISKYKPDGARVYYLIDNSIEGLVREVLDNYQDRLSYIFLADTWENLRTGSFVFSIDGSRLIPPYTRYNSVLGGPDNEPYPYSGYISVVGPSIAKGPKRTKIIRSAYTYYSTWFVGTFTDQFVYAQSTTPGKADCFVRRYEQNKTPVRHQWGGVENDLAYDVASDDIGNATIFLRAGSDFGITSATQSLVRMKTGYNIVRLDTNGLLTETFPVSLEATGELTDTQIALGKSGTVYILAKDNVRAQYFLAKVLRSGTTWIHYFPTGVASTWLPGYGREPRMGLTTDSKENAYVTGIFTGAINLGDTTLTTPSSEAFVAKYSPTNKCEWAVQMGVGMGVTVRLSPDETALYINGWASGRIMGTAIPDQSDIRNGVIRPGAFLVKLKLTK